VPESLPVDEILASLCDVLRRRGVAVLRAPTGAGKTTRVPPALLDQVKGSVVVVQPRRVAVRAAARRMAAERGEKVGQTVGYQVRFERRGNERTRIWVVTDGIMLRWLQRDPFLEGVGAVVLDEVHERGLNVDLCLGLLAEVRGLREDLKLVVMSATLDTGTLAAWLDAPVVESKGRTFPVDVHYLPRAVPVGGELAAVRSAVNTALAETKGNVLVFAAGAREIRDIIESLRLPNVDVLALHGRLPVEAQDRALARGGRRRVVVSTNVAETSVTIPDITAVVDLGHAKQSRCDPVSGLDRLELKPISKASAEQRAGRAGRTQPGQCWRLWPEVAHGKRPDFTSPEVSRVDLAGASLELLSWGSDPRSFAWLDAPTEHALDAAMDLLSELGAIEDGKLSAYGREISELPVHPRLAVLTLRGDNSAALAAAVISEGYGVGSLEARLDRAAHESSHHPVKKLADRLRGKGRGGDLDQALLAAFPDRVALRRGEEPRGRLVGGRGVRLARGVSIGRARVFLCLDVADAKPEAEVRLAVSIQEDELPTAWHDEAAWDAGNERVRGVARRRYRDLVLEERSAKLPPNAGDWLAEQAAKDLRRVLPDNDSFAELYARLQWVATALPDMGFPVPELLTLLPELCRGRRSFADLRKAPWHDHLTRNLSWSQRKQLDELAPPTYKLQNGRSARLQYSATGPPVLAVRMQQMFGVRETPTVGGGRVKVLLHLLAPNRRPQQITSDLAGFWSTTWPQIRKELRARYPKHAWPENPFQR
jgi:ATP-dependent helicase HrpB